MTHAYALNRRRFLSTAVVCGSAALAGSAITTMAADAPQGGTNTICAFVKFLQSLSYDELARTIKELGFDGIEATVRGNGQIKPEQVEDELPKLVEALGQYNLQITVMASDVLRADDPLTERVLRTAASLGVPRYRMGHYRYDLSQPVIEQLDALRPVVQELAAMNRELGISAVYQNHAGATTVGSTVWDLHRLLHDIPRNEIGVAFDIRHATCEGGSAWPIDWNLVQPHVGIVYVKDFQWVGRKAENVPLGDGQVSPAFFKQLRREAYAGPISLHVEDHPRSGVAENIAGLRNDLATLSGLLNS